MRFESSVFINCPFDKDYEGILQAILFCIVYLGFHPRIASERTDSGEQRLAKVRALIEASKYSIHDLSRCEASAPGELFRLNMPFELGIDYACRAYFGNGRDEKRILILEEKPFRYRAAISDLAGFDIQAHDNDFSKAIRKVRNWVVSETSTEAPGANRIEGHYYDFQEWHYERQLANGFSEADIQDYPTSELLASMQDWVAAGKPI
ncbi:MAG: hypothetical protein ACR2PI_23760 [Hyphomicrobiaceae bacterium]